MEVHRSPGRVVHSATDVSSSPTDMPLTAETPAVVVEGGEPHQGSDLATVEGTELGQAGEERLGAVLADARHTLE